MEGVIVKMDTESLNKVWEKRMEKMDKKREKELKEALKKEQEKVSIELTKEQLNHIFQTMKYKDGVERGYIKEK